MEMECRVCNSLFSLILLSVACTALQVTIPPAYVPLTRIAIDKGMESVYIGGHNALFYFDKDLNMKMNVTLETKVDNSACPAEIPDCKVSDNAVTVLEVNEESSVVLVCGTLNNGHCSIMGARNISDEKKLSQNDTTNYLGHVSGSTAAFFGTPHRLESVIDKVLYVAMTTANRSTGNTPAAISTLQLEHTREPWSFRYYRQSLGSHTYIDVASGIKGKFQALYKYGFEHNRKVYFVSVQMKDPTGDSGVQFETKISQICKDEYTYASYTEFPLQCTKDGRIYNIALGAYFDEFYDSIFGERLLVTFGKGALPSDSVADPSEGSVLCVYEIAKINLAFEQIQEDCFIRSSATKVAWAYGNSLSDARACDRAAVSIYGIITASYSPCGDFQSCFVLLFFPLEFILYVFLSLTNYHSYTTCCGWGYTCSNPAAVVLSVCMSFCTGNTL